MTNSHFENLISIPASALVYLIHPLGVFCPNSCLLSGLPWGEHPSAHADISDGRTPEAVFTSVGCLTEVSGMKVKYCEQLD